MQIEDSQNIDSLNTERKPLIEIFFVTIGRYVLQEFSDSILLDGDVTLLLKRIFGRRVL